MKYTSAYGKDETIRQNKLFFEIAAEFPGFLNAGGNKPCINFPMLKAEMIKKIASLLKAGNFSTTRRPFTLIVMHLVNRLISHDKGNRRQHSKNDPLNDIRWLCQPEFFGKPGCRYGYL